MDLFWKALNREGNTRLLAEDIESNEVRIGNVGMRVSVRDWRSREGGFFSMHTTQP